jgi:cell shape-determining protein MreC
MIYTHRKTRSSNIFNSWKLPVVLLVVVSACLVLWRRSIIMLIQPASGFRQHFTNNLQTRKNLQHENTLLQERVTVLESKAAQQVLLQSDNDSLRSILKYTKNPDQIIATAAVITPRGASLLGQVTINQGQSAGIIPGDLVIVGDNVLLGTIHTATTNTAIVDLYSNNSYEHTGGFIIKNLGITTDGHGNGNGNFLLAVPSGVQVVDGDVITLPQYPDRVVGIIKSIESDPRDPFQKVIARTPININELKFVQVVRP